MKGLKVGVIGTGMMGKNHVRIYSEMRGVDEVWVYDANEKVAEDMHTLYGALPASSHDKLMEMVDAVSICVPTRYHMETAMYVLDAGVHALIEKPLASSSEEGGKLVERAVDSGVVTAVGHIERFNPVVQEAGKILSEPRFIELKRHNPASSRVTDSDVVLDLMIHDIDIVWNHFLGGKEYVLSSLYDRDVASALAEFNGCHVSLSASRMACKKIRTLYIEDAEFTIEGNLMTNELYIHRKASEYTHNNRGYRQENIIEKVLINKVEPLREELTAFLRAVRGEGEFPVTIEQALLNLELVEEVRRGSL
ncbi:MAG: Gfo/Idh/MocA family oxidoreductase [Methermicoccaceae archaeon]